VQELQPLVIALVVFFVGDLLQNMLDVLKGETVACVLVSEDFGVAVADNTQVEVLEDVAAEHQMLDASQVVLVSSDGRPLQIVEAHEALGEVVGLGAALHRGDVEAPLLIWPQSQGVEHLDEALFVVRLQREKQLSISAV